MSTAHYSIQAAARRTGLSTHVIRIWEKRYGAVTPVRTATNRRMYSDDQVERLALLRDATRSGHSIGAVATLPADRLRLLAAESGQRSGAAAEFDSLTHPAATQDPQASRLNECLKAVEALDSAALESVLQRAAVELGAMGLLQRLIGPLAQAIGDRWRSGLLTAAHEHFATAVIRTFLGNASRPYLGAAAGPVLVVATPAGQLHELGALMASAAAANIGWHVLYLGASLGADEIAGAAQRAGARAVALSMVYPEDDPKLENELTRLRANLPPGVRLVAGGRAAPAYRSVLERLDAALFHDLGDFCRFLDDSRAASGES
jgi:DNA-binding transcriptional MerR regulator/methylmalonyl-CoA mutase cobalamin-binding subunit